MRGRFAEPGVIPVLGSSRFAFALASLHPNKIIISSYDLAVVIILCQRLVESRLKVKENNHVLL